MWLVRHEQSQEEQDSWIAEKCFVHALQLQRNVLWALVYKKKGCCNCCVDLKSGNCVYSTAPPTCGKVHCPFAPVPLGCARGSVLGPNPSNRCCSCCVNTETNKCQDPPDCTKMNCPLIPANPRCPTNSSLETKGCCPCCVSVKTGDCVDFLPVICPKKPCPNILPPGRRCPEGSSLGTTIDTESGCENCPCCINAGQCIASVPVICPKKPCPYPLPPGTTCPDGSSLGTTIDPQSGCENCPCCVNAGQCVNAIPE